MGIIPVLVVFTITVALCAAWTKAVLADQRNQQLSELRTQAAWLAEAGVRRGAARLARDGAFTGESWQIPAAELGRADGARVLIRIAPVPDADGRFPIEAVASLPADAPRVRVTKTVSFSPPSREPSS